ncbi:uncharacterized protein LOC133136321 isoform X1 [Conger conger]|uniref:uncharacterized protein LOC133136321 isoform X1 n=1 Tax=Conger conger TaxID=82655 RepID=UPI002A5A7FB2|nr:uncharacterized protein LOC133136321 isoform X1 [Conger conger]
MQAFIILCLLLSGALAFPRSGKEEGDPSHKEGTGPRHGTEMRRSEKPEDDKRQGDVTEEKREDDGGSGGEKDGKGTLSVVTDFEYSGQPAEKTNDPYKNEKADSSKGRGGEKKRTKGSSDQDKGEENFSSTPQQATKWKMAVAVVAVFLVAVVTVTLWKCHARRRASRSTAVADLTYESIEEGAPASADDGQQIPMEPVYHFAQIPQTSGGKDLKESSEVIFSLAQNPLASSDNVAAGLQGQSEAVYSTVLKPQTSRDDGTPSAASDPDPSV